MSLEEKKEELLSIAKSWYSGESIPELTLSDLEFDAKENEILAEDPTWDYRVLLDSQGESRTHYYPMPKIKKRQETELSMDEVYEKLLKKPDVYSLPKYDGGGLTIYYNEGALYDAITRSSQVAGKRQLSKISSMVPKTLIDKDIVAIECEVICTLDKGHGDLSRQAATGLLNSNSLQERCEDELTIVGIKVRFKDGVSKNWVESLISLPTIELNGKVTFLPSPISRGKYKGNKFTCDSFEALIDGIVEYNGVTEEHLAHKLYFNEKVSAIIKRIHWGHTASSLKYVPKYDFNTVKVDGTNVSCATAGGTAQLKKMKCGVGASVNIIKSGLTIPQVHSLTDPKSGSENYSLPFNCECGCALDWKDELNGGLYCSSPECKVNLNVLNSQLKEEGEYSDLRDLISNNPIKFLTSYFKIPRFNGWIKLKSPGVESKVITDLLNVNLDPKTTVETYFHVSGLQSDVMTKLNGVIKTFLKNNI
jgi:hypothetical protein